MTEDDLGLCVSCWKQTAFIGDVTCHKCGTPLPGDGADKDVLCDDCMTIARPWDQGCAVLVYKGNGRRIVLGLKHADRTDLAPPAGRWMAQKIRNWAGSETVLVPVPLHWLRLLRRRYNQSALLAQEIGKALDVPACVDALIRPKRTTPLQGHSREARFAALSGAILPNPKRAGKLVGKQVILVDDVMTSGATLAACTEAAHTAGAANVSIVTLARVVKDA